MKTTAERTLPLLPGEQPIPKAPYVVLDDGTNCIPQHYLQYQHTLESVSEIIAKIDFDPQYVTFVDQDRGAIFVQVGIIGKDNYKADEPDESKIVYGRRWRVEPQLPSSEIIQTVFLALLKAREHEIRELLKYRVSASSNSTKTKSVTTPFSCHHDLPLIAMSKAISTRGLVQQLNFDEINHVLGRIAYDKASIKCLHLIELEHNQYLLKLELSPHPHSQLPEILATRIFHLVLDDTSEDSLLYGIMDFLISMSNRYVEENFTFNGFTRFSRKHSIEKISKLSSKTRLPPLNNHNPEFAQIFESSNYETDSTRVPKIVDGPLGQKITKQLQQFDIKYGILPK